MVCIDRVPSAVDKRIAKTEDSKWIAGWTRARWHRNAPPLDLPGFDLVRQLGLPEHDDGDPARYGPYHHSSDLPAFPPSRWPWER